MNSKNVFIIPRPSLPTVAMGHVRDIENVRAAEKKYGRDLIGYAARWKIIGGVCRVDIEIDGRYDAKVWCGHFDLTADDVEKY